jgi:predicted RNA-binding Zn-ribbon protein involved in translation (DUF1610 family)
MSERDVLRSPNPFQSEKDGEGVVRRGLDLRRPECPACHKALPRVPERKTACANCGEFIFIRTRACDNARVVVTAQGAHRIERDWKLLAGAREPAFRYLVNEAEVEAERERLKREFVLKGATGPSDDDVKWGLLVERASRYGTEGNLGLSRNMYLSMADFLTRRWKLAEALQQYLFVCALDINGAQNRGGASTETLREFPLFDPRLASLAPVVVNQVRMIGRKLEMATEDIQARFLDVASESRFPLSPQKAWLAMASALSGEIDLNDQPSCFERIRSLLN